ncbi:Smr protein/MutS2 [Crenothrix polyspora]|uniref:Smr protein/MutS2 n=1 Tax=Crenothrix polyspora TaxID=360316 RepID=A0A1R4H403_9GAMM|nr:Smr/MutS family protein [Crenothrix polyspora]SJM90949.1 Smr protein/MutS2 [Crenothrix polyspora]
MSKKTISSEDSHLFRKTIGSVRAITSDKVLLRQATKPKPVPKRPVAAMEDYFLPFADPDLEKLSVEDTLHFSAAGLQKNVIKKLRQGYFGLDAEIDLHGLNSHDAKQQLLRFLHDSVENGRRCVHIIHGKGYRSPDNHPILKNNLNIWLRQHKYVLAFCSALPKQGGAGAVIVLLQLAQKYDDV